MSASVHALCATPDEVLSARPVRCAHCHEALFEADQVLHGRYDKVDLPRVAPVVTRVERYAARCRCCGTTTLALVPEGLEAGTPFSIGIVALALYLRVVHAVSYRRLSRLLLELFGLAISEGALGAAFRRSKPPLDADVAAILARLRRARVVCSDETGVRITRRTCWNWAEPAKVLPMRSIGGKQAEGFQNTDAVIHVLRPSGGPGWWPRCWTGTVRRCGCRTSTARSGATPGDWQVCLAHQLRDCTYAIEAGDAVFAPRMKTLLLHAVVLARRHRDLAGSTRREYRRPLEGALDAVMVLAPIQRDGRRLRRRYGRIRSHLFTFLDHPELPADNNSSERGLRPTATCRKVTGGFRSAWGAGLSAAARSVVGTAARAGVDAYTAIQQALRGQTAPNPG